MRPLFLGRARGRFDDPTELESFLPPPLGESPRIWHQRPARRARMRPVLLVVLVAVVSALASMTDYFL